MKTTIKNILLSASMTAIALSFNACSLNEENPGGFTMDNLATSEETYAALVNQTVFGMERHLYGTEYYMMFSEGDTDLWTYRGISGLMQEPHQVCRIPIICGMLSTTE